METIENDPFFIECEERTYRLIVEGKTLYVSKEALAMHSLVFKRMLYGNFKESIENMVELKDKKLNEMLEFLHVLFPVPYYKYAWSEETFDSLMTLADEYDVRHLIREGRHFLDDQLTKLSIGDEHVFDLAVRASKFDMKPLLIKCIPYLSVFEKSILDKNKSRLNVNVLAAIYQARSNRLLASHHDFADEDLLFCYRCDDLGPMAWVCKNCYRCEHHCKVSCPIHDEDCHVDHKVINSVRLTQKCLCAYDFDETLLN